MAAVQDCPQVNPHIGLRCQIAASETGSSCFAGGPSARTASSVHHPCFSFHSGLFACHQAPYCCSCFSQLTAWRAAVFCPSFGDPGLLTVQGKVADGCKPAVPASLVYLAQTTKSLCWERATAGSLSLNGLAPCGLVKAWEYVLS